MGMWAARGLVKNPGVSPVFPLIPRPRTFISSSTQGHQLLKLIANLFLNWTQVPTQDPPWTGSLLQGV